MMIDVNDMLKNLKAIVDPSSVIPADTDDALTQKMSDTAKAIQKFAKTHAEQASELAKIHRSLNEIYTIIESTTNATMPSEGDGQKKDVDSHSNETETKQVNESEAKQDESDSGQRAHDASEKDSTQAESSEEGEEKKA